MHYLVFLLRPYELIAVATQKGISIWHLGSNPDPDGRLLVRKVAMLSGHDSEVIALPCSMLNEKCTFTTLN